MAVNLIGVYRDLYMPQWLWVNTLSLARHFGWEPRGTSPVREMGYTDEGYEFSAYQHVSSGDAHHLAEALEIARAEFASRNWHTFDETEAAPGDLVAVPATFGLKYTWTHPAPKNDFAMCTRELLALWYRDLGCLITICREGEFMIG